MKVKGLYLLFAMFAGFPASSVSGQDIDELKEEIRQAEASIRRNEELLAGNKNRQKDRVGELTLVRSNIQNRKIIIATLDKKILLIKRNIANNNANIGKLDESLARSQEEYARAVREAYLLSRQSSVFSFVFSAGDFHDMVRRVFYLKKFASVRQAKAEQLRTTADDMKKEVIRLKREQQELDAAVQDKNRELEKLADEEQQQQSLIAALKKEEGQLYAEIKKQEEVVAGLNRKVEQILAEEARKNAEKKLSKAEEEEMVRLSGSFAQNKGKLPYPVPGVITDRFGLHAHPLQPNLKVDNKGIKLTVKQDCRVSAVFEGEVAKVFFYAGLGNSVMIRHGDYYTVYTNLNEVNVQVGQKVSTQQNIGSISCNGNASATLHFGVWYKSTPQNPEIWLRKK